jgi:glucosamine-6-phosphate deaminase
MPAELRVRVHAEAIGAELAAELGERHDAATGAFLVGCPGGRSLRTTYAAMAGRGWERLVVVMMDEYEGAPGDAHYSCARFAREEIAGPLGVPADRVWLPDDDYDERIAAAGGIDVFLLASGASDGHVAFLGPGSPRNGRTSLVTIAETTRRDNLATFPDFGELDEVPAHGLSVGLGTIGAARSLRLALHGADKRAATARLLSTDRFDQAWPATVVHDHPDAVIYVDEEAYG